MTNSKPSHRRPSSSNPGATCRDPAGALGHPNGSGPIPDQRPTGESTNCKSGIRGGRAASANRAVGRSRNTRPEGRHRAIAGWTRIAAWVRYSTRKERGGGKPHREIVTAGSGAGQSPGRCPGKPCPDDCRGAGPLKVKTEMPAGVESHLAPLRRQCGRCRPDRHRLTASRMAPDAAAQAVLRDAPSVSQRQRSYHFARCQPGSRSRNHRGTSFGSRPEVQDRANRPSQRLS
jgi:hypothetical protein